MNIRNLATLARFLRLENNLKIGLVGSWIDMWNLLFPRSPTSSLSKKRSCLQRWKGTAMCGERGCSQSFEKTISAVELIRRYILTNCEWLQLREGQSLNLLYIKDAPSTESILKPNMRKKRGTGTFPRSVAAPHFPWSPFWSLNSTIKPHQQFSIQEPKHSFENRLLEECILHTFRMMQGFALVYMIIPLLCRVLRRRASLKFSSLLFSERRYLI